MIGQEEFLEKPKYSTKINFLSYFYDQILKIKDQDIYRCKESSNIAVKNIIRNRGVFPSHPAIQSYSKKK